MGVTGGNERERENVRNERRRRIEQTGQPRSYELTKLIANKRGKKAGKKAIEKGN